MDKISVIVPVYNSEKYLVETIDSIAAQTYPNLEVILVDDGSTDSSGKICLERVAQDSRFRYYRVENGGPSAARNIGISHATGDYIGFCDSDDRIDPEMYRTMMDYMERNTADIVFCDIYSQRDQRKFGFPWPDGTVFQGKKIGDTLVAAFVGNKTDNDPGGPLWGSVVRCLFKAENIRKGDVSFPLDIHFAEDLVFTLRYLQGAARAVICDRDFYYYRCNANSIMNSFYSYKVGMFAERKRLLQYLGRIIEQYSCKDDLQKRLIVTSRCYFRECVGNACRASDGRTGKDMKEELHTILNDAAVIEAFAAFDSTDKRIKIISLLIKYRISFVIRTYYAYRFKQR